MKCPRVSVVIPAYNHERYVGEAIQSVLDQSFRDFELIVINDGSTDRTEAEILKFNDDRIRYYSQSNRGLSATLNRGIELARGEYFNFLPSDDAFYPEKLEVQLKAFEGNPEMGVVFSYPQLVDAQGREIQEDAAVQWPIVPYETKEEIFPALFERNFLSAPTALIRIDCFKKVGGFDESLKYMQDYDMWMRILKYDDILLLKEPFVKYRWHDRNLTRVATQETEQERVRLLLKAYHALSLQEIFPSLASLGEFDFPRRFAKAYQQLAGFLKRSGIEELKPFSEDCIGKAKELEDTLGSEEIRSYASEGRDPYLMTRLNGKNQVEKINILMETRSLDKGGLEEVIFNIAKYLDRNLFKLVIVCTERGGLVAERSKKLGIPVEVLSNEKEKEYREILTRYEIDLLVTHYSSFGLDMASEANIPVLCVLQNIYCWMSDQIMGEMKKADSKISRYVAVSEDVKRYTSHRFNISPEKIVVIPNGIDLECLSERHDRFPLAREELGYDAEDYIFLNVAAFTPAKAHLLLLAALKEVIAEHPETQVLCIGEILDREYYEFMTDRISKEGLKGHVKLLQFVEDIHPYYQIADAFLLPSVIEGWSLAMNEAMAHGLPLILTRVGGASEVIENDDIGLLVDHSFPDIAGIDLSALIRYRDETASNLASLKGAMIQFLKEKEYWKIAGLRGKEKVKERLDVRLIINHYEKLFVSVVTHSSKTVRRELVQQRNRFFQEREKLVAEQGRLQKEWMDRLNQTLQERNKEIQELHDLIESRCQQLDNKVEYVLLRLSIKERIKERLLTTFHLVKKLIPNPIKNRLKSLYYRFFPELENKITWKEDVPVYNDKAIYENLIFHFHTLFGPKEIKGSHIALMNQVLSKEYAGFVIYPPTINWEIPLFQRPHQVMRVLAEKGYLCFFCVPNPDQDGVDGLKKVEENLYLAGNIPMLHTFLKEKKVIVWGSNTVHKVFREYFPHAFFIYDFIDELNVFYGFSVPMEEDHRHLVQTADLVVATATNLYESVRQIREDVLLLPNGVYLNDFKTDIKAPPFDLAHISRDGKPIIGYYGALAEWFDYELVNELAMRCKEYNFIIIGPNYDGSIKRLSKIENLYWLGGKNYKELKYYLHFFDVGIIPFKVNQITSSTSPLKLFEYMAGRKPIVTTNLKECRKYDSVFVAEDREDFIRKLSMALTKKNDPDYLGLLKAEAEESSWHSRLEPVIHRLRQKGFAKEEVSLERKT